MKITVIIENTAGEGLIAEHGLSLFIEYENKNILLDMGASENFAKNSRELGIDLRKIDIAVLSHAHYDHSGGMDKFFEENKTAPLFMSKNECESCMKIKDGQEVYIGIPKGVVGKNRDRIRFVESMEEIEKNVYIIPHSTEGLSYIGKRENLFVERETGLIPDSFDHEISLVFDTEKGLVIFNSCSHGGADVIINEVKRALPGQNILAYIGGLHLVHANKEFVLEYGRRLLDSGVENVYTGHCTGDEACSALENVLGKKFNRLYTGLKIEL